LRLEGCAEVRGPASLRASGDVEVLGYRPRGEVSLVVPVGRSVIVCGSGEVEVSGGAAQAYDPASLRRLQQVAESLRGARRAVLIGPTDSGKSTLAAYLYNTGAFEGLLSVDVGQNELYCPGFAAAASPARPFMPGMTVGEAEACLVGDFTPRGLEARYLYCSARLSKRYGRLVVDTDGWVHGEGLELKAALAAQLDATGVAIGLEGGQLRALKQYVSDLIVVDRLAPYAKSQAERRANRDRLIASCLSRASRRLVSLDLVMGRLPEGGPEGLLTSAYGEGRDHFAVIERLSERSGLVSVLTGFMGQIEALRLGRVRIDLRSFQGLLS
jgi:polynucleotide 5'-hydroxyl-kinase GRC3/NOL9